MVDEIITLNVGGIRYQTYGSTLSAYPETMLGAMFADSNRCMLKKNNGEYFIDRNKDLFQYILDFYRNGVLFLPYDDDLRKQILREADFFSIPYTKQAKEPNAIIIPTEKFSHVKLFTSRVNYALRTLIRIVELQILTGKAEISVEIKVYENYSEMDLLSYSVGDSDRNYITSQHGFGILKYLSKQFMQQMEKKFTDEKLHITEKSGNDSMTFVFTIQKMDINYAEIENRIDFT
ncbi:POZ domain-containing protein [Rhizophagus irregularis]|uniref:POZ domain-containing protein n=1 Tax=Rhizophagus irregularis TaxID=588596 RepID=A0A2N0S6W2_9GLOM|nr:POZ domain-containing protein [Rhizophagus irregularis]CAB4481479.1 unnamed protein product [Rhizophagus irregularis]